MSQETLVSQSSLSDSPKTATFWFPVKPPRGYEALPYDDSGCESDEEDSDAEFWALKPATDIEANPVPRSFPASSASKHNTSEGTSSSPPADSHTPSPPRTSTSTRTAGVLKMSVILTTAGLPSALFFSAFAWLVGGIILRSIFKVAPYDTMDSGAAFKASIAGAPVVAAAAGALAFLDFVVRRLPRLPRAEDRDGKSTGKGAGAAGYDPLGDAVSVASVCALASVLAMPLGFVVVPRLATETFGAWHALGWSATGLGVPIGGLVLAFLPQMLWCDKVDL